MSSHDALLELADRQHGLVARRQADVLGYDAAAFRRATGGDGWAAVSPNVRRRVGAARTETQMLLTPILEVGADATLSHLSAAAWWGLTGCSLVPISLVTTATSFRPLPGARVRQVRTLPPNLVTELRGVPVVGPELLAIQLFAVCSEGRANALVDRLWSARLLDGRSIAEVLRQLGERGRNGVAGLRRYLDARGGDYLPPASGLERRAMELFAEAGLRMRRQVGSGGAPWTGRIDFRHETAPLIVEIRSEAHHTALVDHESDARRVGQLRAEGFTVVEISDTDVWARADLVVRTLRNQRGAGVLR